MTSEAVCEGMSTHSRIAEEQIREWLIASNEGDWSRYHQFLETLANHLRGWLRRCLPQSLGEVEDILQEILLAVHNARHTYRPDTPVIHWIHAIARYKCQEYLKMHGRPGESHDALDDRALLTSVAADAEDPRRDIRQLVNSLPRRRRLPVQLVKFDGLSVADASRRSGLSRTAIVTGIYKGMRMLSAVLSRTK